MNEGRLLWRIYLYFLLATLLALAVTTAYSVRTLRHFHEDGVARDLEITARLVADDVARYPLHGEDASLNALCRRLGELTGSRVTVILPDGQVVGDTEEEPSRMDNHAGRPEIMEAMRGARGESSRFSDTLKRTFKYVALPVERDGRIVAVVRLSRPVADIVWARRLMSRHILLGALIMACLFAAVALFLSKRITRPLEEIRKTAEQLARGDLDVRAPITTNNEVGALARTLNEMAAQLGERLETISRQQVEQRAVLTCMVEGVLAVDPDGRILYMNQAASRLLDVDAERARGRTVQETVRQRELQDFILAMPASAATAEAEMGMLRGVDERRVRLHGTPLVDPAGQPIGCLVVINDITKLKRLETVRSDFVANVSHELKTPITALRGCVETLSDDPPPEPEDTGRFIAMMSRHIVRLEAIVDDLLSLSRIEFDVEQGTLELEPASLGDVLQRAIGLHADRADAKDISVGLSCPDGLTARVKAELLEQAIGNLVDNAVKYSDPGTHVEITVTEGDDHIAIAVADQGPGIEQQHIPRVFERFYRIDKARSRAVGGTGLGLSIVKHIALAHQGNVSVTSTHGTGSCFTLRLPKR